ncbi:plasma-membrane proton-e [Xylaria sp. FL1042]|nr:plasma-membrane proton-e [Xylaria sp. FL1042]
MAEPNNSAAAPALNTNIESGHFDEKAAHHNTEPATTKPKVDDGEEDDEDIDALIEDLESDDGGDDDEEEEEGQAVSQGRTIPDEMLNTDTRLGLTDAEVTNRRRKYGLNQMKEEKENLLLKFFGFFVGPIQFVMEAAAVLAAGLEDWVDFGVIIALLLLNAAVGFIQEYQAGSIVDELKKTLALKAVVLRDGTLKEIEAPQVVPGDILQVEEGTIIPADGRIVTDDAFLQVDQSALTGESLAVDKHKNDQCFASSAVKRGEAFMVVTATGDNTFVGRAAALVSQASGGTGHFTEVLNGIGTILLVLVILTLLVVWISSFYRSNPIVEILGFTLAITIVGVPVGLPAVVTTTMAVGAAFLAKKKAIVQKLSAIESLAGVEILCSDKTGTLTKNKLSLSEPFTVAGVEPDDLMLTACLAASRKKKGMDAIDKAFLKALKYYPRAKGVLSKYIVKEFYPFDPVSKKVTAIVESPQGEIITCVKGAPLFVLKTVAEDHPVPEEIDQAYKNKVAEFATRGFRSLGVARKRGEGAWEILGIMPCSDPPRHDTARTINEAKRMGLSIKMLTGDAVGIARETSRQLGLGTNVYNAERLGLGGGGDMPGSEVYDFVEAADGFAEVFPQHKYNVVEILQQRGYLVGMTGDGVNDAPSLKKADTGIAVEGASDAARSAADIVFLAPGLGAIIDALKTSRQIFHRMYAYVVYRIALSLHLEIFLGLWIAILNRSLNIELVVFIAIFADVATLAIAYDNAPYSMSPVKWNLPKLWGMSVILGIILAVGTWITVTTLYANGENGGIVQNNGNLDEVLFLEISLTENWLIFITRANGPFWSSIPSWQLTGAIFIVDVIATLFCIFGWFEDGYTHIVAVVRIWIFSFGIFSIMGGVYYFLQDSTGFDNLMHGKSPKGSQKQRSLEDFDAVKRRYFKVENSKTAPTNAAWSSDTVKRRKLHDEGAAAALRHLDIAKTRVRRARVLHEPLTGGFFAREYGAMEEDMQAACFVEGMEHKGCIPLLGPGTHDQSMQVKHMFVAGHDHKTGMCNVYAGTDRQQKDYPAHCVAPAPAASSAVCAVGTSRGIAQWGRGLLPASTWLAPEARSSAGPKWPYPSELFHDVFAIDFHPSHGEILRFGGRPGVLFTADTRVPSITWSYIKLPSTITHLRCLNGGNQVLVAGLQNQLGIYDLRFARTNQGASDDSGRVDIDDRDGDISRKDRNRARNPRGHNSKGRNRNDKRAGKTWSDYVNKPTAQPVIQFEHYRNMAHIDIGFAYDATTGVVATAHDDIPGTVALYSVRTGSRLRVLDLALEGKPNFNDEMLSPRSLSRRGRPTPERKRMEDHPVIQSLQFQAFPGDHTPTLFVGSGPRSGITAFTFGVDDLNDEAR